MEDRIATFHTISTFLPASPQEDILSYCIQHRFEWMPVHADNVNSDVFSLITRRGNKTYDLLMKKIPMSPHDFKQLDRHSRIPLKQILNSNEPSIWKELFVHKWLNRVVLGKHSPHFPLCFGHHFSFNDLNAKNQNRPDMILLFEKMDTDLKTWARKQTRKNQQWINVFLQLFFAIWAMQRFLRVCHNDLHWGNILLKKLPVKQSWAYRIAPDRPPVALMNQEFLLSITDFGFCRMDANIIDGSHRSLRDYKRLVENIFTWVGAEPEPYISEFIMGVAATEDATMSTLFDTLIQDKVLPASEKLPIFDMTINAEFVKHSSYEGKP